MAKQTEACGRCSASTVVDVAQMDKDESEQAREDPFADASIEVDHDEFRRVSPGVTLAKAKTKLDELATRLAFGR